MPKLAYCAVCTPPVALAAGNLPSPPSHVVDGKKHVGTMVEISPEEDLLPPAKPGEPQEAPDKFLARMMTKYVTKTP